MKRKLVFFLIILLMISCKKDHYDHLAFILAGQDKGTGIRYVNPEPDDTLKIIGFPDVLEVTRALDLNFDNRPDFELKYTVSSPYMLGANYSSLVITPLGMNAVCISESEPHWADSLSFNDTINANLLWSDTTALLFSRLWVYGEEEVLHGFWYADSPKYLGVMIKMDQDLYFGWLDIKGIVLKEFAITMPY